MQIEIAGQKALLEWQYFWDDDTDGYQWVTTRAVLRGDAKDNREPIAFEEAICSPRDKFVKDTGRKISLARLLKAMGLSREQRRDVWNQYHARKVSNGHG